MGRPAERRAAPQLVCNIGAGAPRDQELHQFEILVDRGLVQGGAVGMNRQEAIDVGAGIERQPRRLDSGG